MACVPKMHEALPVCSRRSWVSEMAQWVGITCCQAWHPWFDPWDARYTDGISLPSDLGHVVIAYILVWTHIHTHKIMYKSFWFIKIPFRSSLCLCMEHSMVEDLGVTILNRLATLPLKLLIPSTLVGAMTTVIEANSEQECTTGYALTCTSNYLESLGTCLWWCRERSLIRAA